jgi:molybdenum cofactor guanylyltransferase
MARQTPSSIEHEKYGRLLSCRRLGAAFAALEPAPEPAQRPERTALWHALYDEKVSAVSGFILAGGKSSRMGSNKSFLVLAGQTLLARALELVRAITPDVRLVGEPTTLSSFGSVISDIFPARGPLGGIHSALASSSSDWNLVVGVDLPFLEARFLTYLVTQAQTTEAVVTLARIGDRFQPLCAVYHKAFLAPAEAALVAGRNRIDALFSEIPLRIIDDNELISRGYNRSMFANLNTPADWEWAQREFPRLDSGISRNER